MNVEQISWQWANGSKPQHVCAALAWHNTRLILVNYLLNNVDENQYKQLQIISNSDVIVLIGHQDRLPWFDGIQYAGYDDIEPRLWRPSHKIPNIPLPLLADSLCNYHKHTPILIWDFPKVLIPLDQAQFVDKPLLNALMAKWGDVNA